MADILITHSYLLDDDPKQKRIGQPLAPLGTLYALSVLRQSGFSVSFYDPMFRQSPEEIIPVLQKEKPRILVICEDGFSYLTKMCLASMRKVAFRLAVLGHQHGATVIISSPDANDNILLYLDNQADFILVGEAELTLKELVGRILSGRNQDLEDIPGLAFKKNELPVTTRQRPVMESLDDLSFPAWDVLDVQAYRKVWKSKNRSFTLNMVTTRGCPYKCIWCAKPIYGNHYNSRSPLNVVNEMIYLRDTLKPDQVWFADDIFGLKPGWTNEFAKEVLQHKLDMPFSIQSRVDLLLDDGPVSSLAAAGCKKIWLGIESGSQKILDSMQKGITVEQVRSVSPLLRKSGIEQGFFLQLGFPGENKQDIDQTIDLLTELMPDDVGISITYPLPGTRFYDTVKTTMAAKSNWEDSDELSLLFKSSFSPAYYKLLHRYIHKYFRYKQSIYFMKGMIRDGAELSFVKFRRIMLLPWYFLFSKACKLLLRYT